LVIMLKKRETAIITSGALTLVKRNKSADLRRGDSAHEGEQRIRELRKPIGGKGVLNCEGGQRVCGMKSRRERDREKGHL